MVETHLHTAAADRADEVQNLLSYVPSTPHLNPLGLAIRDQGNGSGRGIYATRPLSVQTVVEISPVLLFPPVEYATHGRHTQLDGYTFVWKRTAHGSVMALALGIGSLFNHHPTSPNVNYTLDHESQSIRFTLTKDVGEGEELCISYGAGRMWWEDPTAASQGEERSELDEEEEYRRMAGVGAEGYVSDSEHEQQQQPAPSTAGASAPTAVNGIELGAEAGPSRSGVPLAPPSASSADTPTVSTSTTGSPAPSRATSTPVDSPLYRITSARDPRTLPLTTTPAWVVDIAPRNSSLAVKFLQKHADTLQCRDDGRFPTRHLRSFKTEKRRTAAGKDETRVHFLVCLEGAVPRRQDVVDLLRQAPGHAFAPPDSPPSAADAVPTTTFDPQPYLYQVPTIAAPTKERLAEWTRVWPCIVRPAGASSPNAGPLLAPPGTTSIGLVDRSADASLWTADPHRLRWALNRFRRVVALARRAQRGGDLGIAVHVTHPYEQSPTQSSTWTERERLDWTQLDGAAAPRTGRWRRTDRGTTSPFGPGTVEIDGTDARRSLRNPLKHAVVQSIAAVASLRAADRLDRPRPTESSPTLNGQDYLLTELVLFATHEPCVYCTMALVHSRVRAVFFLLPSPGRGGCCGAGLAGEARCERAEDGGVYALQEQRGLNHSFQVWRWVGEVLGEEREQERERASSLERIKAELDVGRVDP